MPGTPFFANPWPLLWSSEVTGHPTACKRVAYATIGVQQSLEAVIPVTSSPQKAVRCQINIAIMLSTCDAHPMQKFGKVLENYFIPGVVVVAVLIGAFAVKTYNNDADIFIKP